MNKSTNFLLIFQEVWVKQSWLQLKGVPYKTIENGCKKSDLYNPTSTNRSWLRIKNKDNSEDSLILYSSIPKTTLKKQNLPSHKKAQESAVIYSGTIPKAKDQIWLSSFAIEIELSLIQDWHKHLIYYQDLPVDHDRIRSYCQTHEIFEKVIGHFNKGERLSLLFEVYKLFQASIEYKLVFQTSSYHSFQKKIKLAEVTSICDVLIHDLLGKPSNSRKVDQYWRLKMEKYYRDERKFSYSQITRFINNDRKAQGLSSLAYSTIRRTLESPEIKNKNLLKRRGDSIYKLLFSTYSSLKSKEINEVWEVDGTRLPFVVKTKKKSEYKILNYMMIVDVCSKKIIGYSIGENENSKMLRECLLMAISSTGVIPKVMIHDGASYYNKEDIKRLKFDLEKHGMVWIRHSLKNPQSKGSIERIQQTLDSKYFRKFHGFLGEGIKSRRKDAHPSQETLSNYLKPNNRKSIEEVTQYLEQAIAEYNNSHPDSCNCPLINYAKLENSKLNAGISFNTSDVAFSMFEKVNRVVTRSVLKLQFNRNTYEYNIPYKFRHQLIGIRVIVVYNQEDFSKVFLFDIKSEKFICELKRKTSISRFTGNRTKEESDAYRNEKRDNKRLKKSTLKQIETEEKELERIEKSILKYAPVVSGESGKEETKYSELSQLFFGLDCFKVAGSEESERKTTKNPSSTTIKKRIKNRKIMDEDGNQE